MSGHDVSWGEIITSWSDRTPISQHLDREIRCVGETVPSPIDPVPGCDCPVCETLVAGGTWEDAAIAEEVVRRLATRPLSRRFKAAAIAVFDWREVNCILPAPEVLVRLVGGGGRRITRTDTSAKSAKDPAMRRRRRRVPLPVERARSVPILDVCQRLGIKLRGVGRSYRGPCPIHGGDGPNFSVQEGGGARCWSCGWTGDGIALVMQVRGLPFHEAVRELAA
jgi:hypothetical protein